jgi:hypothetical protein
MSDADEELIVSGATPEERLAVAENLTKMRIHKMWSMTISTVAIAAAIVACCAIGCPS